MKDLFHLDRSKKAILPHLIFRKNWDGDKNKMAIEATLKDHSLFKKQLPWHVILGNNLEYGVVETEGSNYNAYEVDTTKTPTTGCVTYQYKKKARGIYLEFNNTRTKQIKITLPLPSTEDEIVEFFDMLKRISEYWKCDIAVDENVFSRKDITEDLIYYYIRFNEDTVNSMCKEIIDGEANNRMLPCLTYPLILGKKEAEKFYNNRKAYYQWMNDKQSLEDYYATPKYYADSNGENLTGQYLIIPDIECIFPYKPTPAYYIQDESRVKDCKDYFMSSNYGQTIKASDYREFIENIPEYKKVVFDDEHFTVQLTYDEIMDIYRRIEEKHTQNKKESEENGEQ